MKQVTKRDGTREELNLDKIHQILFFACDGITGVSVSEIELRAQLQFHEGISTETIHDILIKAAAGLITKETPNYQYVAGRLVNYNLRKKVYGRYEPIHFAQHVQEMVEKGIYDPAILDMYTVEEIHELGKFIRHRRDDKFTYAAMEQLVGKYLLQNRVTKEIYETPQMAYMMIAATLFGKYPSDTRISFVKRFYDAVSNFDISLPTPIMAGVRTNTRQFSSCVTISAGDSLDSIATANHAIIRYISRRAGIGINYGRIRAEGSAIRGGEAKHTGLIPFLKSVEASVKSCSQGGVRGGAATVHYPMWHLEFESLVVLKNNKGTEESRVRKLDHCFQLNRTMYERLVQDGNITLFSPADVPGLYDAFIGDQDKFAVLYRKYEADPSIRKITLKARDAFAALMTERQQTGRIYIQNIDHVNDHGSFKPEVAPIEQSNLCVAPETEILTDKGYIVIGDNEGKEVNVWNGSEFSTVTIEKTGTNQNLLTVSTDAGHVLECTPYHKFYVVKDYNGTVKEVRANELRPGDKLIKFTTPVIEGEMTLDNAYANGFYSGDGCDVNAHQRIYLYGIKQNLRSMFDSIDGIWTEQPEHDRIYLDTQKRPLQDKFFVPGAKYTVESRLDWLSGYVDADGCVYRNKTNQQLTMTSVQYEFLVEVQKMLHTLGVQSSIRNACDAGMVSMPDGKCGKKEYKCNAAFRLLISSTETQKLITLGLQPQRLSIVPHVPNRQAMHFVKVLSVLDEGRISDTYCFNEPLRHKGVFNGLLTGQCQEIALPTKPLEHIDDANGMISLCTLAAINWGNFKNPEDMAEACELSVRALDALLDYQDYPIIAAERSTMGYRPLGVGIINFAYFLAKRGLRYDKEALDTVHEWTEAWSYYLLKASVELAKEKGACEYLENTKYGDGILPIDTYKKSVDSLVSVGLKQDWEGLRSEMKEHGIRNATLMALMPSESSSQISNSTSGIDAPRSLVTFKNSKDGILPQVVPEIDKLKNKYDLLWQQPSNTGPIMIAAVLQKFIDQAISFNTNYVQTNYQDSKIPMKLLIEDLLLAYKLGHKNWYYCNTNDGSGELDVEKMDDAPLPSAASAADDDCDSCKI